MENRNAIEIDFLMLIKKLLLQWRVVFVVALVCGLLVMNIHYVRAKVALQSEDGTIEDSLTNEEIAAVNDAISLNNDISNQESYINENLYMSINALDYKQLTMTITIHAEAGVDARDIASLYISNVYSNKFADKIIDVVDEGLPVSEFAALLSASAVKTNAYVDTSVENSDLVKVNILIPDSWNQDILREAVQSAVEEIEIENYSGEYRSSIDYIDVKNSSSLDIQDKQASVINSLATMKTQLKTYTDAFTADQKELYDELLSGKTIVSVDNNTERLVPQMSPKYLLIGFFIGMFAYTVIYVLIICFDKKCHIEVSDNLKLLAAINLIEKSGVKGFIFEDRLLKKALFKKETRINCQMKSFAQKLKIMLKGQKDTKVLIVSSKNMETKLRTEMTVALNFVNIEFIEIESSDDIDAFVNVIQSYDACIIVMEDGVTYRSIASELQNIAMEMEVQHIGELVAF